MSPIEKFTQKTTELAESNLESPQIYAKKEKQKNRVNLANNVDEINKISTILYFSIVPVLYFIICTAQRLT